MHTIQQKSVPPLTTQSLFPSQQKLEFHNALVINLFDNRLDFTSARLDSKGTREGLVLLPCNLRATNNEISEENLLLNLTRNLYCVVISPKVDAGGLFAEPRLSTGLNAQIREVELSGKLDHIGNSFPIRHAQDAYTAYYLKGPFSFERAKAAELHSTVKKIKDATDFFFRDRSPEYITLRLSFGSIRVVLP